MVTFTIENTCKYLHIKQIKYLLWLVLAQGKAQEYALGKGAYWQHKRKKDSNGVEKRRLF